MMPPNSLKNPVQCLPRPFGMFLSVRLFTGLSAMLLTNHAPCIRSRIINARWLGGWSLLPHQGPEAIPPLLEFSDTHRAIGPAACGRIKWGVLE